MNETEKPYALRDNILNPEGKRVRIYLERDYLCKTQISYPIVIQGKALLEFAEKYEKDGVKIFVLGEK